MGPIKYLEDVKWEIPYKEVILEQLHMTKKLLHLSKIQYTNLGPMEHPFSCSKFKA
jgi:hypothetical protein